MLHLALLFLMISNALAVEDREERLIAENPSPISGVGISEANSLVSQVGRAVITEGEKAKIQAEKDRLAKMAIEDREKEEARLARVANRKLKGKELPKECIGYVPTKSYQVTRGVTLGKIASEVYNNSAYATLISVYNKKPANRLFLNEYLKTPSPYEIFTELAGKAVYEKYPYAIRDILEIHESFKKLQPTLVKENDSGGYSKESKQQLDDMIWRMEQVKKDFFDKVEGVNQFPVSATTQLHSAYKNLKRVRKGDLGRKNLRLQRVNIYLINGYSYAMAWGRDGFVTPKPK